MKMTRGKKNRLKEYLKLNYPIRMVEDPGRGWFVEIPDLPGCMTVVDKFEDACKAIELVKQGWMEIVLEDGREVPLPSTDKKYSGKFSLRIPPSLHERLVEQADAEGVSLNAYCTHLLSLGAGRREVGPVKPSLYKPEPVRMTRASAVHSAAKSLSEN